jgi:hypothetical protein
MAAVAVDSDKEIRSPGGFSDSGKRGEGGMRNRASYRCGLALESGRGLMELITGRN